MILKLFAVGAISLVLGWACATTEVRDVLRRHVEDYNNDLRWKRFRAASLYLAPDARQEFLEKYLPIEDDIYIESLEVQNVNFKVLPDGKNQAYVLVTAQAYKLPSTVLRKITVVQTWEQNDQRWQLLAVDHDLIP